MLANAPSVTEWASFFTAQVGASASLTGLVIVAISINLPRIVAHPHLPGRALESLAMLIGVLLVSSVALVPGAADLRVGLRDSRDRLLRLGFVPVAHLK